MATTIQSMKTVWRKTLLLDLMLVAFFLSASADLVLAHDAPATVATPLGWSYDASCCSDKDCRPIPAVHVEATATGWLIKPLGEIIGYGSSKLRHSPDGLFHWCECKTCEPSKTRCLYAPGMGS